MKVKLALKRQSGAAVDIVVTADSTATVEDVARAIARNDPATTPLSAGRDHRLTLAVVPPTGDESSTLDPDLVFSETAIGSGFTASVIVHTGRAGSHASSRPAAAMLQIHTGPAAGRSIELPAGNTVVGRGADADLVIDDALISKRHARVEVGSAIEIVDLNSANGIVVDGSLVQRLKVIPGQRLLLGDTEVSVIPVAGKASVMDPVLERGGGLLFNRSPRVEVRYNGTEYPHPAVPTESTPRLFPWPMVVTPVLLGLVMFSLTQRPASLLVVFASPLMMLGNLVGQRSQTGKKLQREVETFETQIGRLEDELTEQRVVEHRRRHEEAPAVATVYEQAMRLGPLLWTRRPEHWNFLSVRLGTGRSLSRNSIRVSENNAGIPEYTRQVERLTEAFTHVDDVPITEHLQLAGALGIAAPTPLAADIVRGIGVQLFGTHAPNEIITAAIVDPAWTRELEWLKWLPHTSSPKSPVADFALADNQPAGTQLLSALEEIILERLGTTPTKRGPLRAVDTSMALGGQVGEAADSSDASDGDMALVLFVSADAPVDRPRLTQLIERGPDAGIYTVFLSPTVEGLPAACRTFIDATRGADDARIGYVRAGETYESIVLEGVSAAYADMFARRLAPVIDASTVTQDSSDLPSSVSMLAIIGHDMAEQPASVLERWRQNNSVLDRSGAVLPRLKRAGTLRAFIGQGATDAMSLDLRTNGPHALVGGTTGAGKSEFLQAWVLGMAAEYSPDRVTFLFVDYKGGSAFADCVDLPHTVGLVTDLSPHLVRRALTSLRAELHHREHLFNRKKAKDLLELEKRRDPETPPALVLVIDEFAALAGDVPEFVDGVVDIAQRGRSLGIHLIMATQRPAGVIKDNLRANTNLRVALRMADESDSRDVVGESVAATFDPSLPGRGIAKTGPGRLVPFQSAYAGGWSTAAVAAADVKVGELRFGPSVLWESDADPESDTHAEDLGPNDQKRMVRAFIAAAETARIPAPRRPWLDDLPPTVDILDLPVEGDGRITLGLADIPARQRQEAMTFQPDRDGSMLVYGTSGSGKSTVLRTIAAAAGLRPDLGSVEVYGLDFGSGALRSIETLPHVGSVIGGDDGERVQRLLRQLATLLDERGRAFSDVNAASLAEYREITGRAEPRILVLLDGFGQFKADWDSTTARLPFYNVLMRVLAEGRPLGIHVVATADRAGAVPTAVSANVTKRVVLRLSDESAYQILGVPKDVLSDQSVPGRAIVEGLETQLAAPGGSSNVAEQSKAIDAIAERLRSQGAPEVPDIGALPTEYPQGELPSLISDEPALGIADDTLGPIGFEPIGTFAVTGPPQSGKTNTMRALVTAMQRFDPGVRLMHIGGRRAQLGDAAPWMRSATTIDDVKVLAKELVEVVADESVPGRILVVVETVNQFADTEAERPMKELFQAINRSDHFLIGEADVSALSGGFGFIGDFKAGRRGVALKPDSFDGDSVFKTPFPKVKRSDFPPGRGIFVQNGRITTVQLPLVEGSR